MPTHVANLILLRENLPVGAFFVVPDKETTLGRSSKNTIILSDERSSRFHATLYPRDGKWYLKDLDSRNGTAINGQSIVGEVEIKTGDRIQVGHETLFFCVTTINESGDSDSMKYSLAVSDTLAAAVTQMNNQRELTSSLDRARSENLMLRSLLRQDSELVGSGPAMQKIHYLIDRVAPSKATVLIRGESGVGKELVARAIHNRSPRQSQPLICLNCAILSESLLASELFGHEKGAFTGATERKIGKFEAANGGTLFLDEIAEMSPALQAKFLRVIEGQPFERVGGNKPVSVDVRVIAATNRDLEAEVTAGRFRHDLFFRLRVLEILVPPLRKKIDDIPILADFFLQKYSTETNRKFNGFTRSALETLQEYRWPGNVRELKNVIERAVLLAPSPMIDAQDLLLSTIQTTGKTDYQEMVFPTPVDSFVATAPFSPKTLDEVERNLIEQTLDFFQWNKSHTAKALGIERTTLDRKITRYDIKKE